MKSDLTELDRKWNSALSRFNGKVHLIIYLIEEQVRQNRETHTHTESWDS